MLARDGTPPTRGARRQDQDRAGERVITASKAVRLGLAAVLLSASWQTAQAATISISPASQTVNPGDFIEVQVIIDFQQASIGGGIDIDVTGPLSIVKFTPTASFSNPAIFDPAFTGFGTAQADRDFEIHFGTVSGFVGSYVLGNLELAATTVGLGEVKLAINSFYGGFFDTNAQPLTVQLAGAEVNVVPLPAGAWLLLTAVGGLAGRQLRRSRQ